MHGQGALAHGARRTSPADSELDVPLSGFDTAC
jgi:hypothetical protein